MGCTSRPPPNKRRCCINTPRTRRAKHCANDSSLELSLENKNKKKKGQDAQKRSRYLEPLTGMSRRSSIHQRRGEAGVSSPRRNSMLWTTQLHFFLSFFFIIACSLSLFVLLFILSFFYSLDFFFSLSFFSYWSIRLLVCICFVLSLILLSFSSLVISSILLFLHSLASSLYYFILISSLSFSFPLIR